MGHAEEKMETDLSSQIALFTPRLRAFALSLGNNPTDAEDLAQETCLRAIGARDRFAPDTNLKAWLFTILHNLHRNRRRDMAARPRLMPLDEVEADPDTQHGSRNADVERQALDRAQLADVMRAFRSLPPVFAIPLHLVAVEDLAYAQVAAMLEIPIGTVMSRIYRARRLLLRRLAEDER
ncbi:MAG: sigma-70 family RNA polymerase sigma factor [Candidatus Dormibacteria bacterium]